MNTVAPIEMSKTLESVLLAGDLSKLSTADRLFYYTKVCESVGLNPLTRPFDYLTLNGKMVLYAKRDATDQLRKIHGVSVNITGRETIEDVYVVTAKARDKSGREDESTGAVTIGNLKGDARANALMKAETKAKRRVTLSICGLGLLDETELETIPAAARLDINPRGELGTHTAPALVAEAVQKVREALSKDKDLDEDGECLAIFDLHTDFSKDADLYVALADSLAAQEIISKSAWKAAVKRGRELAEQIAK